MEGVRKIRKKRERGECMHRHESDFISFWLSDFGRDNHVTWNYKNPSFPTMVRDHLGIKVKLAKNRAKICQERDTSFPWWLTGEKSAWQYRGHRLISDPVKPHVLGSSSVHAPQRLSLCSRPQEPQLPGQGPATAEVRTPKEATLRRSMHTVTRHQPHLSQLEINLHRKKEPKQPKIKI